MNFTPETARRATRVGAGMLVFFAAALLTTIVVTGIQWKKVRQWTVVGTFGEGISGIKVGSPVLIGGAQMGEVTLVELQGRALARPTMDDEQTPGNFGRLIVHFELDGSIDLRADAKIVHEVNPLSGRGELDILNVGTERTPALPGRVGRSAMLAPNQPMGRSFSLSARQSALERILGKEGAEDWNRITETVGSVRAMFVTNDAFGGMGFGREDVADTTPGALKKIGSWGENPPGSAVRVFDTLKSIRTTTAEDVGSWRSSVDDIDRRITEIRGRVFENESGSPTLTTRFRNLQQLFGHEQGLRGLGAQLQTVFGSQSDRVGSVGDRIDRASGRWRAMVDLAKSLWPEVMSDLRVTRTGFVIGTSVLWLATGPEVVTSLVRALQPMSQRELEGLRLILSANRVAESGAALREAVEAMQAIGSTNDPDLSQRIQMRLERMVKPALERYRRDLSEMREELERFAIERQRR